MISRTVTTMVVFSRSFLLAGAGKALPAGGYLVETDEELVQGVSPPGFRRVATFLRLPQVYGRSGRKHALKIDPDDLEAALTLDRANIKRIGNRRKVAD